MTEPTPRPLESEELLRVMDAAQVIRARQAAVEHNEAFDRDAAIREIQVMYEELGDLVDKDVIEQALDEYLSERHSFVPAEAGAPRTLALLYIRRAAITKKVLLPLGAAGLVLWGGMWSLDAAREAAQQREAMNLRNEVAALGADHGAFARDLELLGQAPALATLPEQDRTEFDASVASVRRYLEGVAEVLEGYDDPSVVSADAGPAGFAAMWSDMRRARDGLALAERDMEAARFRVGRHERLEALAGDGRRLAEAIREVAREAEPRVRAGELASAAARHHEARDVEALQGTVGEMQALLAILEQEFEVVATGGVWRFPNDNREARNYYLIVRAVDAEGRPVRVGIRNEENGGVEMVSEWAERVPQEVYDRVGADKQDNGIIEDDHVATKRRGYLGLERRYPDVGQITRW